MTMISKVFSTTHMLQAVSSAGGVKVVTGNVVNVALLLLLFKQGQRKDLWMVDP